MAKEVQTNNLRELIPDSIGKDIEKACQSVYPHYDVFTRKVKMLKKPEFELGKHMKLQGTGNSSGKAPGHETGDKVEWASGYETPVQDCLKFRRLMVTNKKSYLWEKKKSTAQEIQFWSTFSQSLLPGKAWYNMRESCQEGSALPPETTENSHCPMNSLWGSQHSNPKLCFFLLILVLPYLVTSSGPGTRWRLLHGSLPMPVSPSYPNLWFRCFHFLPFLRLALWSLSPEPTFITQLEITTSSLYQLFWEPWGVNSTPPTPPTPPWDRSWFKGVWPLHRLTAGLPFCLNSFHCSLLISNSMIH